jgi:hypothetical protein
VNRVLSVGIGVAMILSVPLFIAGFVATHHWQFLLPVPFELYYGIARAAGRRSPGGPTGT